MSLRLPGRLSRELGAADPAAGKDRAEAAAEQKAEEADRDLWGQTD